jgi:CheY-like chemotaxis protein
MDRVSEVVMVADADANVRELVGRFVREAGYTVTFAKEGYEALDNARRKPPLAILADVMLPRLDGLALCRLLKGDPVTEHIITVVVFSVLAAEEQAKKAGADAFVQKPLEKTRLLKILEEATKQRRRTHE